MSRSLILSRNLIRSSHSSFRCHFPSSFHVRLNSTITSPLTTSTTTTTTSAISTPTSFVLPPNPLRKRRKPISNDLTEDGYVLIYKAPFAKKHWLIKAYAYTMFLALLQSGYYFYNSFSKDPKVQETSPFKPYIGLMVPSFMAAVSLRMGLNYAKQLLNSIHYHPQSHQVKITFPNLKFKVVPKDQVKTHAKLTVATPIEQTNHNVQPLTLVSASSNSKSRLNKNVFLYVGNDAYVLEKKGYFSGNGKLLDLYFYAPLKPSTSSF